MIFSLLALRHLFPDSRMFVLFKGLDKWKTDGSASARMDGIVLPLAELLKYPLGRVRKFDETGLSGLSGLISSFGIAAIPFVVAVSLGGSGPWRVRISRSIPIVTLFTAVALSTPLPWLMFASSRRLRGSEQ